MRAIAVSAGLGMAATLEARVHAELENGEATSCAQWVRSAGPQLQAPRRRLSAARSGQVPLGGRLAGRRGDGGGARVSRPRHGRPDSARLRVHRELGGSRAGALRRIARSWSERSTRPVAVVRTPPVHDLPWRLTMYP